MVDIATNNYSSRNGQKVIWVAIHTTEGIMDANDLGYYWQRVTDGSSHAGCDNNKTKTYIDPQYASWTLLNGNRKSVNMEICGWARWTRAEWLGPQRGRLVQAANWARQMCDRFGIPKRHIGAEGVARNEAGIIGHVDYTNGARDGSHWDPGPGFPWDVFITLVNGGDDVSAEDVTAGLFNTRVEGKNVFDWFIQTRWDEQGRANQQLEAINNLAGLLAKGADVDENAIAQAIVPALVSALPEQLGKYNNDQVAEIAKAVNDELARRQSS